MSQQVYFPQSDCLHHAGTPHQLRGILAAQHSVHLLIISFFLFFFNYTSSWPVKIAAMRAEDRVPSGRIPGRGAARSSLALSSCSAPLEECGSWQLSEERRGSGLPILLDLGFPHLAKNNCLLKQNTAKY